MLPAAPLGAPRLTCSPPLVHAAVPAGGATVPGGGVRVAPAAGEDGPETGVVDGTADGAPCEAADGNARPRPSACPGELPAQPASRTAHPTAIAAMRAAGAGPAARAAPPPRGGRAGGGPGPGRDGLPNPKNVISVAFFPEPPNVAALMTTTLI